jgi:hypothetical protein
MKVIPKKTVGERIRYRGTIFCIEVYKQKVIAFLNENILPVHPAAKDMIISPKLKGIWACQLSLSETLRVSRILTTFFGNPYETLRVYDDPIFVKPDDLQIIESKTLHPSI